MIEKRKMLDRWEDNLEARMIIEDFWMWLQKVHPGASVAGTALQPLLDEYHEIDQRQLDKERRLLLNKNSFVGLSGSGEQS